MNIHLREVICTSKGGDRFWRMPECYICGNTIKYLRVPDEVIDKVQEETKSRAERKPPGVGHGRGRGREDGPGGRQPKGAGRGLDDDARTTSTLLLSLHQYGEAWVLLWNSFIERNFL